MNFYLNLVNASLAPEVRKSDFNIFVDLDNFSDINKFLDLDIFGLSS